MALGGAAPSKRVPRETHQGEDLSFQTKTQGGGFLGGVWRGSSRGPGSAASSSARWGVATVVPADAQIGCRPVPPAPQCDVWGNSFRGKNLAPCFPVLERSCNPSFMGLPISEHLFPLRRPARGPGSSWVEKSAGASFSSSCGVSSGRAPGGLLHRRVRRLLVLRSISRAPSPGLSEVPSSRPVIVAGRLTRRSQGLCRRRATWRAGLFPANARGLEAAPCSGAHFAGKRGASS